MSSNSKYEKAMNLVKDVFVGMAIKQQEMNKEIEDIPHEDLHHLKESMSGIPLDKTLFEIAKRVVDDPRYPQKGMSLEGWVEALKAMFAIRAKGSGT